MSPTRLIVACTVSLLLAATACAPAAPAPTAPPAKPTEAPKPAAPAAKTEASPAAKPAEAAKPAAPPASPAAAAAAKPAEKSAANDYYAGKTITLVAGSSPGGGTDNINRLVAKHLGRFIPGNPNVIVQNVEGAGGIIALNQVAVAKPDGLTFNGSVSQTQLFAQLQGTSQVRYDLRKLTWVGTAFEDSNALWVRSETPYTSLDAIRTASVPPKLGAQSGTHSSVVLPKVISEVTGLKFNVVTGYPGSPEIFLDIERGALDGRFASYNSLLGERPEWVKDKYVRFLLVTSRERSKDLPDVPTVTDIVPPDKKALLSLVYGPQEVNRTMAGPPGIDPAVAKLVVDGYAQMAKDKQFLEEMTKIGFEPGYTSPASIMESLDQLLQDAEMQAALQRILGQ